jgi:Zn-dependent protease
VLLFNPSIEAIIAVGLVLLVALPFHEFSHALAAFRLGDPTAKYMGRLTLNPLAHLDPLGSLLILFAGFGWAKPTPYNPYNLQGGRSGEAIVGFAGPASNLVLATAAALPLRYIAATNINVPFEVVEVLFLFLQINVILMIFNLVPIPPLDGSKVLFAFLDPQTERQVRPVLEQYGFLILIAAMLLPILPGNETVLDVIFRSIGQPLIRFLVGPEFLGA